MPPSGTYCAKRGVAHSGKRLDASNDIALEFWRPRIGVALHLQVERERDAIGGVETGMWRLA